MKVKTGNLAFVNPLSLPMDIIQSYLSKKNLPIECLAQETIAMPLGIMYLSSCVKKHSNLSKIGLIDYKINFERLSEYNSLDKYIIDIAQESVNFIPDILAFSLIMSISHNFFIRCLHILKSIWPETIVVGGGFHATNFTRELLENKVHPTFLWVKGKVKWLQGGLEPCKIRSFIDIFWVLNRLGQWRE